MRLDRIGLANEIKTMEGREEKPTKCLYQIDGDSILLSYVDKKMWEKKHCCPFNNAFKCPCYERWAKETSYSYVLWAHKRGRWCGWSYIFSSVYTLQMFLMASECPSIFAWHYSNEFKSFTRRIFKTWCYVNIWIYFSSRKAACSSSHTASLWAAVTVVTVIVTVCKVLPCRKLEECFVSEISIVLFEM